MWIDDSLAELCYPRTVVRRKTNDQMPQMQTSLSNFSHWLTSCSMWHIQRIASHSPNKSGKPKRTAWIRIWWRVWCILWRGIARWVNGWHDYATRETCSSKRLTPHSSANQQNSSNNSIEIIGMQHLLHESFSQDNDSQTSVPPSLPFQVHFSLASEEPSVPNVPKTCTRWKVI